jgi:hypothetical protein
LAAKSRCPRSSSLQPNVSQRNLIPSRSIMHGAYDCSRRPGIRLSRSAARPRITIHLSLKVS